jgi:hypothetical protein
MNLGFVVNNLGNSEKIYDLLNFVKKIPEINNSINPCIFFQNAFPPLSDPNCLTMNILGISNFTGKVVAFDIESAQAVYNNNSITENWLYLYDLPWLSSVVNYEGCLEIMRAFKIVVKSKSQQEIVKNFTGFDNVYIAENMEALLKCLT